MSAVDSKKVTKLTVFEVLIYKFAQKTMPVMLFFCVLFFALGTTLALAGANLPLNILAVALVVILAFSLPGFYQYIFSNVLFIAMFSVFFLFLGFYAAFIEQVMFEHNTFRFDFGFLRIGINNIFYMLFGVALFYLFKRASLDKYHFLKFIFYIALLNSALILFSFINQDFRVLLESYLYQSPTSNINYMELDWRLRGIAAGGGASLSMFNAFAVLCGILATEKQRLNPSVFLFGALITLASCMVIARTGLMIGLVLLAVWVLLNLLRPQRRTLIPILVVFAIFSSLVITYLDVFMRVIPWALEIFFNLIEGQGASSKSTDDLFSMFDIPDDPWRLLFGFGFIEAWVPFRSDSGYIKTIYSIGFIGALVLYSCLFYVLIKIVSKHVDKGKIYWFMFVGLLMIAEIKEPFIYQNYFGRALLLFVLFFSSLLKFPPSKLGITEQEER